MDFLLYVFAKLSTPLILIVVSVIVKGSPLMCDRRQYVYNETCCNECQPGSVVLQHCTSQSATLCQPCELGVTYMDDFNRDTECKLVSSCQDVITKNATLEKNLECHCPPGFYKDALVGACLQCSSCTGIYYVKAQCSEFDDAVCGECSELHANSTPCPAHCSPCVTEHPKPNNGKLTTVIASMGVLLVVIVIVCVVYLYRKKCSKSQDSRRVILRRRTNGELETIACCGDPSGDRLRADQTLPISRLNYDVILHLARLLNPKKRLKANWINLAQAMGMTKTDIVSLKLNPAGERLQCLLQDFNMREDATARRLHQLLLKIKRTDAAALLEPYLQDDGAV